MAGNMAVCSQAWYWRRSWELYIWICRQQGEKMPHWAWLEHLRLQSPPLVTHFLQQSHIYSNKAKTSNSAMPCDPSIRMHRSLKSIPIQSSQALYALIWGTEERDSREAWINKMESTLIAAGIVRSRLVGSSPNLLLVSVFKGKTNEQTNK